MTYSPLQIYVPIFLQQLHGLDPLAAGFTVASASLGWTAASLATAGASESWRDRLMLAGPTTMGVSLMADCAPHAARCDLVAGPAIVLLGIGIGQCRPFVAQRVMGGASGRRGRRGFIRTDRPANGFCAGRGARRPGRKRQRTVGRNCGCAEWSGRPSGYRRALSCRLLSPVGGAAIAISAETLESAFRFTQQNKLCGCLAKTFPAYAILARDRHRNRNVSSAHQQAPPGLHSNSAPHRGNRQGGGTSGFLSDLSYS